jgi:hypothetical protein
MPAKKYRVIRDELGFSHPNGGMYCLMPFDELDDEGKSIFKVGISSRDLNYRTSQYSTYFSLGLNIMALLENPPVPKGITRLKHYQAIEKFIFDYIVNEGEGYRLKSTDNSKGVGYTEWFYTYPEIISEAFTEAHNKFGGHFEIYDPTKILANVRKILKKPHYVGKIFYPLIDPPWVKKELAKNKKK